MRASRRRTRGLLVRILSVLRAAVCALVLLGLVPWSHEMLENLVHLLHDGHLAHSKTHEIAADTERCVSDAEHDCTPLAHHCDCCVSIAGLPDLPALIGLPACPVAYTLLRPLSDRAPPALIQEPPSPPPNDTQMRC